MEDEIIKILKDLIKKGDLTGLKEQWKEFREEIDFGREIAWDYVFQKVYLSACCKKQVAIVQWLEELYTLFNPVIQIAIRPTLVYGKYILYP